MLCLASKKPSEREFFVPAGTDLDVKLLTILGCWRWGRYSVPDQQGDSTKFLPEASTKLHTGGVHTTILHTTGPKHMYLFFGMIEYFEF